AFAAERPSQPASSRVAGRGAVSGAGARGPGVVWLDAGADSPGARPGGAGGDGRVRRPGRAAARHSQRLAVRGGAAVVAAGAGVLRGGGSAPRSAALVRGGGVRDGVAVVDDDLDAGARGSLGAVLADHHADLARLAGRADGGGSDRGVGAAAGTGCGAHGVRGAGGLVPGGDGE